MTKEYGTLFSHASETAAAELVTGGHRSRTAAEAYSCRVRQAQPGIEAEPMARDQNGPWRSTAGLTAHEVIARRWA
jgi:hypothetical protein